MDRVVLIWWAIGLAVVLSALLGALVEWREEGRFTAKLALLSLAIGFIAASAFVAPDMLDGSLTPATSPGTLGLSMLLGIAGVSTAFAGFRSAVGRRRRRFERDRDQRSPH